VHYIDRTIDGGGIIAQARPQLSVKDDLYALFYKSVEVGISLMDDILGMPLIPGASRKGTGRLYCNRELTDDKILTASSKCRDVVRDYLAAGPVGCEDIVKIANK